VFTIIPYLSRELNVTHARYPPKNWLRQNANILFPLLAFAIPLIVRAIPEILMGQYLVGFDTIGYYVPNTLTWLANGVNFWSLLSSAPLIYALLMGITAAGAPIVVTLKILGPLILGLLGVAAYFFANKALSWSPIKSLFAAFLSTLYFVALRISWDMFRSELALVFLFIALIYLQRNKFDFKNGFLFSLAMFLVVLTHQLFAVVMFAILIATLVGFSLKKKKNELVKLVIYALPAVLLFLSILYLSYFVFSSPVIGYSVDYGGGFDALTSISHNAYVFDTLGFLAFCYLPMLPLLFFGARRFKGNFQLKAWIIWLFIPIFLVIVSPINLFIGGVLPFRWVMLLTYPLSFYLVEGIFAIRWNWYKIFYKVAAGSIIAVLSVGFMVLPNSDAISYFGSYPTYIPKSMLQNTIQLSDCQDTANALLWAQNNIPNNGHLLVHQAFYGWSTLSFDINRIIPYFFENLTEVAINLQQNSAENPLYLIWWVNGTGWYGQPNVPGSFSEIYHSHNIAIYEYLPETIAT
jgi:hypothetical protein